MDVSTRDSAGMVSNTKLFVQAPITTTSVVRQCDTLQAANSLRDIVDIDMAIGLIGHTEDWDSSVREISGLLTKPQNGMSVAVPAAKSLESALVTIVLKCSPAVFANPLTSQYHIEIDDLVTMHFLDPVKYDTVRSMVVAGTAYSTSVSPTGHLRIVMSQEILSSCAAGTNGDFSCAVRRDISDRNINNEYAVHSLANGTGAHDDAISRYKWKVLARTLGHENLCKSCNFVFTVECC